MAYHGRAFVQDVPMANKPSKTLTLFSYQGGLDNVSSQSNTKNECATNVLNMVYLEDGLIQKRYGTKPKSSTTYDGNVCWIDTFHEEGGSHLIIATERKLYIDDVAICDVAGKVEGITMAGKYMFVDGHGLYSIEKVNGAWKRYQLKTPVNLEDALKEKATKGDKFIIVNDPSKFKAGQWIQIGERKVDEKGKVVDTPPPQTSKIYKIEGNKIILGEEIKKDKVEVETTTRDEGTGEDNTTSDVNKGEDKTIVNQKKVTGTWNEDGEFETITKSERLSGTAKQTTTTIRNGVSVVFTKNKQTGEDEVEVDYENHRLKYDYPAGTKVIIFPNSELYKYIGDWKDDGTYKWYEPCVHEIRSPYFGVNVLPPKPTHICYVKGRVVISGGDKEGHIIYMSDINNPYYFPVSTGLAVNNTGEPIIGLKEFHDSVVVARPSDMTCIYGSHNNPEFGDVFSMKKITTHTGCISNHSMRVVNNYLFYLGSDGVVYRMHTTNTDVRMLATSIVSQTVDLSKAPLSLTLDEMKTATSTYTNEHYYLSIGKFVLVYSYRFMAWTVFDRLDALYMYNQNEEVIWGKGNRLFQFDKDNFLDDKLDFNCFWESKLFDLDLPVNYKYFKYISLVFDTYEHFDSTAKVIFEIDYEDVKLNYVFKNAISRWGKARWGVDRFATRNISKSLPIYVGRRGRLVKVKVHNGNLVNHVVNTKSDLDLLVPQTSDVAYVRDENTHYKLQYEGEALGIIWVALGRDEINQPIKLYNIEIEYSLRGRR